MGSLAGFRWEASNEAGTWKLSYRFEADGRYTAFGQPAFQETGVAKVVKADAQRLVLRLTERRFDGQRDDDVVRELVFADDGASFVLGEDTFRRVADQPTIAADAPDESKN
jgi:hypothetical protein